MSVEQLRETLEPLLWLKGSWTGKGFGQFPTIEDFVYEDEMEFEVDPVGYRDEPLILFEEKAWVFEGDKRIFKHWETGYFKPTNDGRVHFYVCHNTGRVEVSYGTFSELNRDKRSFKLVLESDYVRNEEGLKKTLSSTRAFTFKDNMLEAAQAMSTEDLPANASHLKSLMHRVI